MTSAQRTRTSRARGAGPLRVCLLGCGGFIGSHLTEWLLDNTDAEIVGTDIESKKILHLLAERRFTYHDSDLQRNHDLTRRLVETSDVVVDLVAIATPALYTRDPLHVFELDFLENLRVADMCADAGTRLVQFSTCEVYGKTWLSLVPDELIAPSQREAIDVTMREDETPLITGPVHRARWIYSASKHLLERVIHAYGATRGLDYSIIRPFNVLGPRFDDLPSVRGDDSPRMFAQFMDALLRGGQMSLVDGGSARRTFVYAEDAAECIGRIVVDQSGVTSGEIFNVGNPRNEATVAEVAQLMRDLYAERYWDHAAPLAAIASVPSAEFFGDGYEDTDRRIPDVSKAKRLLGWEPRWGLRELLIATMDAYVADYRGIGSEQRSEARPAASELR